MAVDIPQLRYAAAVARLRSFSAAARACGVAQPTVSGAVAELEERLGARLFERTTRKLSLTPSGERLLPMIENLVKAADELALEAEALRRPSRRLLRIAFSPLLGAGRIEGLFEPFRRAHPSVELVYKECMLADMEERLDAGTVDVVCGTYVGAARNRGRRLLYREPLLWVPPAGVTHRKDHATLLEVGRARLVFTADVCGLTRTTRELFKRARVPFDSYSGYAMSYATLEEWADLGIGGALLPKCHVHKSRGVPVHSDGKPLEVTYEVVWRKDLVVAEHMTEFVSYLTRVVPKLVKGMATAP